MIIIASKAGLQGEEYEWEQAGIDFSLKSTKAISQVGQAKFISDMKKHINNLVDLRSAGVHPQSGSIVKDIQLDIAVPEPYDSSWLKPIEDYASEMNVEIDIFETK